MHGGKDLRGKGDTEVGDETFCNFTDGDGFGDAATAEIGLKHLREGEEGAEFVAGSVRLAEG